MTKPRSRKRHTEQPALKLRPISADQALIFLDVIRYHFRSLKKKGDILAFAEFAIDAFLAGEYKSLDEAFGLKRRGRPAKPGKYLEVAKIAWEKRVLLKQSYRSIADELSTAHRTFEDRDIRRMLVNYEDHIVHSFARDFEVRRRGSKFAYRPQKDGKKNKGQ